MLSESRLSAGNALGSVILPHDLPVIATTGPDHPHDLPVIASDGMLIILTTCPSS